MCNIKKYIYIYFPWLFGITYQIKLYHIFSRFACGVLEVVEHILLIVVNSYGNIGPINIVFCKNIPLALTDH